MGVYIYIYFKKLIRIFCNIYFEIFLFLKKVRLFYIKFEFYWYKSMFCFLWENDYKYIEFINVVYIF